MELAFTKLFNKIVTSSVWSEDDKTRIMWITLLALADRNGYVAAALPGLADVSRMSIQEAEAAIKKLESPDKYSRTKVLEGRRIVPVDGGWEIVTYDIHRHLLSKEERRQYKADWIRKRRQKCRQKLTVVEKSRFCPSASASSKSTCTEEESIKYCTSLGLTEDDGHWFFDRCVASGWKNAGKPIVDWQATVRAWKRSGGIFPSQKQILSKNSRSMSAFEIEKRIAAITAEINAKFKANGSKRVEGDGLDVLKKRRDELQKSLLA